MEMVHGEVVGRYDVVGADDGPAGSTERRRGGAADGAADTGDQHRGCAHRTVLVRPSERTRFSIASTCTRAEASSVLDALGEPKTTWESTTDAMGVERDDLDVPVPAMAAAVNGCPRRCSPSPPWRRHHRILIGRDPEVATTTLATGSEPSNPATQTRRKVMPSAWRICRSRSRPMRTLRPFLVAR